MRILRWLGIALVALVAVLVGIGVVARFSDGPIGPFPGGPLRTGTLVSEPDVDWSFAHGSFAHGREIELQLVEPPGSRIVGGMVHEGQLFAVCDLGFLARRLPDTTMGWMLSPIYRLKRWHEDALRDGRAVVRIGGKRYERQAVRVTDPELLATLRSIVEEMANQYFSSPLLDVPTDPDAGSSAWTRGRRRKVARAEETEREVGSGRRVGQDRRLEERLQSKPSLQIAREPQPWAFD